MQESQSGQFKQPSSFIKYKESVYEGYEMFSFKELNYEITEKDMRWLANFKIDISYTDFEKVIDIFEKIVANDQ